MQAAGCRLLGIYNFAKQIAQNTIIDDDGRPGRQMASEICWQ